MIDILKNNLSNFNINTDNTIVCNASELETSSILNSLLPEEKSNLHLNVKVNSDKDIEHFLYVEQNGSYKSINIIIDSSFNLSKFACQKLEIIANINSVLKYTDDNKIKGCSFKNYFLTNAILKNSDTDLLLSNESLLILKNFSKKENDIIIFQNTNTIPKEILDFFRDKKIIFEISPTTTLNFDNNLLRIVFERIDNYTNSININIEINLKFEIIYRKILGDIINDFENFKNLYNDLSFIGYHFILYQTFKNLNINANLILGKLLDNDNATYYLQVNLDKYWFNLDIIWNFTNNIDNNFILQTDKEFYKTHSTEEKELQKCNHSYKKFYKKYTFFKMIKNKFFILIGKNKRDVLGLPAPDTSENNKSSIFQDML